MTSTSKNNLESRIKAVVELNNNNNNNNKSNDRYIRLVLTGDDMNYTIAHMLRHGILLYIPVDRFHNSKCTIDTENTKTAANHDILKKQIESLTIPDLPIDKYIEDPKRFCRRSLRR
jgi:hypothetical protein